MKKVKLNGTIIQGDGLKYPINPNVILGDENNGYAPGTILDANAIHSITQGAGTGNTGGSTPGTTQNLTTEQGEVLNNLSLVNVNDASTPIVRDPQLQMPKINNLVLPTVRSNDLGTAAGAYHIVGQSNIACGQKGIIQGLSNVLIGDGVVQGINNIVSGATSAPIKILERSIVNNIPKIKLEIKATSQFGKYIIDNNTDVIVNIKYNDTDKKYTQNFVDSNLWRNGGSITTSADGYIELNNLNLSKIYHDNEVTHVILVPASAKGNYNAVFGTLISVEGHGNAINGKQIFVKSNYSIASGLNLKVSNNYSSAIGVNLTTTNTCEHAVGINNISIPKPSAVTNPTGIPKAEERSIATLFTIGDGVSAEQKANALEVKYNGDLYIQNVGGYNGSNSGEEGVKSIQKLLQTTQSGEIKLEVNSFLLKGTITQATGKIKINSNGNGLYLKISKYEDGAITKVECSDRFTMQVIKCDHAFTTGNGFEEYTSGATLPNQNCIVSIVRTDGSKPQLERLDEITITVASSTKQLVDYTIRNSSFNKRRQRENKIVYDNVLKSIATNVYDPYNFEYLQYIQYVSQQGWNYIQTNAFLTMDNEWIVSREMQGIKRTTGPDGNLHEEQVPWKQMTRDDAINNDAGMNALPLDTFCKLCKVLNIHPYILFNDSAMADNLAKPGDAYDGKPIIYKAIDTIVRNGLNDKFTTVSPFNQVIKVLGKHVAKFRLGLMTTTPFSKLQRMQLTSATIGKVDSHPDVFLLCNIIAISQNTDEAVDEFIKYGFGLEVYGVDDNTDIAKLNPFISGAICSQIHFGEKIYMENV